jgi:hypothetical protein
LNANFLKNAFDRLGNQGAVLGEIKDNTAITAASVTKGGDLFDRIDTLVTVLEDIVGGKKGGSPKGVGLQESLAMAVMAPTLKPIGLGLGYVVDAINKLGSDGAEKAKALEGIIGVLTKLGDVGKSVLAFAGYMVLALPFLILTAAASPLILIALTLTVGAVMLVGKMLNKETMENLSKLKSVGLGILVFAGSLALTSIILPYAIKGAIGAAFIIGIIGLTFFLLNILGVSSTIEDTGKALMYAGLSILSIGVSLALFSIIEPWAMKGLWSAAKIILIIGLAFAFIDAISGTIGDGGKALLWAAASILAVGLALFLFNLLLPGEINWQNPLLAVGGVALVFGLLGLASKQIQSGAKALLWASLAMIVVGIAFILLNMIIPPETVTWESFLPLLVIAGVGAAFVVLGFGASLINQGATAMILAGVAIILLAVGIMIMAKPLAKGGWELIGQIGALVAMIAIEFGLLGLAAPFVLAGAAAMLVAGVAMILLGTGTLVLAKAIQNGGDITKSKNGETQLGLFISSVADAFDIGLLKSARVAIGGAAMISVGMSLILIGQGIKSFTKIMETVKLPDLADNIAYMIGALAIPFEAIGAGKELVVKNPMSGEETPIKFTGGSGGFFGLGGSNPVSMGVMAVMNMGRALSNIAAGVQSMAMLKFPTGFDKEGNATGYNKINAKDISNVVVNTQYLVGGLAVPFAKIGAGGKTTIKDPHTGAEMEVDFGTPSAGGLMGFLTGGGDVQKGIHAVMNMGQALSNIAQGVQDMAMLKMPTGFDEEGKATGFVKFNSESASLVTSNTQMLVSALAGTFAEIGAKPEAKGTWWGGKSVIQKGIDLVSGMGTPLFNLAKGVQEMANLKFAKSFDKDGNVTEWYTVENLDKLMPKIENNSIKLIKALTNVFTKLGESAPKGRGWTFWKPTNFEKGIKLVERIADPFAKLAEAARSAGEVTKSVEDADKMHHTIKSMIDAIMGSSEGTDLAFLPFRISLIEAIQKAYATFETAIPAIVQATASFKPELGKAFMSIFGGESTPETLIPKITMLSVLSSAYSKMATSVPKITGAIGSLNVESTQAFEKLIGGGGFLQSLGAKTAMYTILGMTYMQMGVATPRMTGAINSLDPEKAQIFSGIFINKEKGGLFSNKYEDQTKLWRTIGSSMMMTSVAMPKIAEGINNMDLAKLTEARTMFEALGVLANGGAAEDILAEMGESLEQAMQRLADILKEFQTTVGEGNESNASIPEKVAGAIGGVVGAFKDGASGKGGGNSQEVVNAINQLNRALIKNGVKISNIDDLV